MSRVRTRFAPSPTGSLHLGNARTAVLNWMIARHHGGEFILRIEDTDMERNVEGAEGALLDDLAWLGLDWDEGPAYDPSGSAGGGHDGRLGSGDRGPHAPYHQRGRLDLYRSRAAGLLAAGSAYRCFCTPEELEAERRAALDRGDNPRYSGRCRALPPADSSARAEAGEPHVIRLSTPAEGAVEVEDVIRGTVTFQAEELGDFVLVRSDGVPTYNFAVVVDDVAMEITHVVRGAGHLSNTPYQLLVYRALEAEAPVFAHAPTVLGPDRRKLSKRTGARPLRQLRQEGYHPDAVVNYLSLLGWSSPSGDEVLERDRLVAEVTLDRMNAADVVYDPEKLRWLSAQHIDRMGPGPLLAAVRPYLRDTPFAAFDDDRLGTAVEAVRSHLGAFGEITDHLQAFLGPDDTPALAPDERPVVRQVRAELQTVDEWEAAGLQAALKAAGKGAGVRGRELYVPVRRALTGAEHGPPLGAVLEVQGRETVLRLLERAANA